jgi:hypothetical protein
LGLIVFILIIFIGTIPFASQLPDGLEKVVYTNGVQEKNSIWNGIMQDYLIESISNPINSTIISGIIGFFIVLISALILGKTLETKKYKINA